MGFSIRMAEKDDDIKLSWDVTDQEDARRFARIVHLQEEVKAVTEEPASAGAKDSKGASSSSKPASAATGRVTEDEIRAVLLDKVPVTTQDLVAKFKSRLRTKQDKAAFVVILSKISKLKKTNDGPNCYVVLRRKRRATSGSVKMVECIDTNCSMSGSKS